MRGTPRLEDKREIVLASLPHLPERREQPLPRPRRLARDAGTNRSYLLATVDNPIGLILDWSAPNGHHGSLQNCEGKAARYGPEVMDAVTGDLVVRAYGIVVSRPRLVLSFP